MTLSFVEMGSGWKINSFGFQGLSPPYFTSKVVCTVYNFIQKCLTQKGEKLYTTADFIFSYLKRKKNKNWSIIFDRFFLAMKPRGSSTFKEIFCELLQIFRGLLQRPFDGLFSF